MRPTMMLLPLVVAACSQAPASTGSTTLTVTAPPVVAAAGAPSAASTPTSSWDERDFAVPSEKFGDAQRNFEAARKALLEGYYTGGLTEEDLYRAAVAGMVERVDPQMHKWNRL